MKKDTIKLIWEKSPFGGESANYKLGRISRIKIKGKLHYHVELGFNNMHNAKSLVDAKKKIDIHTEKKIKK